MLKINKKIVIRTANILLLVIAFQFIYNYFTPGIEEQYYKEAISNPSKQLKSFSFNTDSDLISRVAEPPDFVLKMLRELDGCPAYLPYTTTKEEKNTISQALELLPPVYKDILKMRLVNIYFVKNFYGGGITEWVLDEKGKMYFYIVFNPEVLKMSPGDWFSYRDTTCFVKNNKNIKIKINCGEKYRAFVAVLLHESTHIVDCVLKITPYLNDDTYLLNKYKGNVIFSTPFSESAWQDIRLPLPENDFPFRPAVTFYGLNHGPMININNAEEIYRGLSKTALVSLYSGKSWAEDCAEFVAYSHYVRKLKQPYIIKLYDGEKEIFSYEPMKNKKVTDRYPLIDILYGKSQIIGNRIAIMKNSDKS